MKRDVDRLVAVSADVEADAPFRISARAPRTTLREQIQLAERSLRADCSAAQANQLADALG